MPLNVFAKLGIFHATSINDGLPTMLVMQTAGSLIHNMQFLSVSYVGERPRWPMQSPNKGRKKKAKG